MRVRPRAAFTFGLCSWLGVAACSLVVDTDSLQSSCGPGTKACEITPGKLTCVSTAEPEYGCARESCVPCTLSHAVEVCGDDGECTIATCEMPFDSCDFNAKNGCEVDKDTDYEHCGSCNTSCAEALRDMPRTVKAQCSARRCVVKDCEEGYADCDGAASNGCERRLPPEACGRCDGCPRATECNQETGHCE